MKGEFCFQQSSQFVCNESMQCLPCDGCVKCEVCEGEVCECGDYVMSKGKCFSDVCGGWEWKGSTCK